MTLSINILFIFHLQKSDSKKDVRDFFVGVNDTMAAEEAAKAIKQHFPDGANIVEVGGQSGHDVQIKRHDGFGKGSAGTNINLINYKAYQQWSPEQAMNILEDMITKHGDAIDGVFCHWDNGATGVIGALQAAGMDDKYIVAVDGNRTAFEQVRSGNQDVTIMQNFETMAIESLELTKRVLAGEKVDPINFVRLDVVTLENIDNFTPLEW